MTTLTAERVRELLAYDPITGALTRLTDNKRGAKVGYIAGYIHVSCYRIVMVDRENHAAHRLIWLLQTGTWPTGEIDHMDGEKDNNRFTNLRDVDRQTNMQNEQKVRKNNKSGLMGVHWRKDRSKWVATLKVNGKSFRLGSFTTPEEAAAAYLLAKRKQHPGFIR